MMADSEYCMARLYYQAKRSNKTAYVRHYHGFLSSVIIASTLHMRDVNIRAKNSPKRNSDVSVLYTVEFTFIMKFVSNILQLP